MRIIRLLSITCETHLYLNLALRLLIPGVAVTHRLSNSDNSEMNDLQRSVKSQEPPTEVRSSPAQTGRKLAIYILAGFIVLVMIVWFGFLGWGFIAILQNLLDYIGNVWAHF
jgi:hypothetical protein